MGFGPIVTFASYNSFRHRIYRDSTIVSLADTGTSILAGVTVFSILGNLAYESGKPVETVVKGGLGLAFVSYPEAISKFNTVPQVNLFISSCVNNNIYNITFVPCSSLVCFSLLCL